MFEFLDSNSNFQIFRPELQHLHSGKSSLVQKNPRTPLHPSPPLTPPPKPLSPSTPPHSTPLHSTPLQPKPNPTQPKPNPNPNPNPNPPTPLSPSLLRDGDFSIETVVLFQNKTGVPTSDSSFFLTAAFSVLVVSSSSQFRFHLVFCGGKKERGFFLGENNSFSCSMKSENLFWVFVLQIELD